MEESEKSPAWQQFLNFAKARCSATAYQNWLAPIEVLAETEEKITLKVPNVFVKEYLLANYGKDLRSFLPVNKGEASIAFEITPPAKTEKVPTPVSSFIKNNEESATNLKLNSRYRFEEFIEGPTNQFVKSAAIGVAAQPGKSYNPLVIHGAVGLGKTHLLHSIGHYIGLHNRQLRVHCITTEDFINNLVDSLRKKTIDKLKKFYRSDIDVLLVDDIQFLQNRLNFEEEFCNTFEALFNQRKQIVITSDKPPGQLKLSERIVARMEWGLVAHIGIPELETRVAILQHKAKSRGLNIPNDLAFFIAEQICGNVRQLEGAVNKLSAQCCLMNVPLTEDLVMYSLKEMLMPIPQKKVSVEEILKAVANFFNVRVSDLKGTCKTKNIAFPRQIAMYLTCELIKESVETLSSYFGKTHSTLLHARKTIMEKLSQDETLRLQVAMVRRHVTH